MTMGEPTSPDPLPDRLPDPELARYAPIPKPSGFAVAALVLGIIGLFLSWITFGIPSILAVIFGHVGLGRVRRGVGDGRGMAIGGLVLGYVVIAVFVVAFGVLIAIL
jgi:Domain of unknown function (DUF4190)